MVVKKLVFRWNKSNEKLRGQIILTFTTGEQQTTPYFYSNQGLRLYLAIHYQPHITNGEEFQRRTNILTGLSGLQDQMPTEDVLTLGEIPPGVENTV